MNAIATANRILQQMAAALSLPYERFAVAWSATRDGRGTGALPSVRDALVHLCQTIDHPAPSNAIDAAGQLFKAHVEERFVVRPDALSTLAAIKQRGLATGLITNCGGEDADCFDRSPLAPLIDCPAPSNRVGYRKPDPRIFTFVAQRLNLSPRDCLFVGDGQNEELHAATQVGMRAVLVRGDYKRPLDHYGLSFTEWSGPRIPFLANVLDLL